MMHNLMQCRFPEKVTTGRISVMQPELGVLRTLLLCFVCICNIPTVIAIEIIANVDNVGQQLKEVNDLRSIFSLRTRYWENGEKIRVFVLPDDHPVHKVFVKEKLHMFPHQLRRTWNRMTYTGTGQPPIMVNSVPEMIEKIKGTQNSIGYIDMRIKDESIQVFDTQ